MCLHSLILCVNAEARHAVVPLLPESSWYVLGFLNPSTLYSASELQACCILLPVIRFASVLPRFFRPKTCSVPRPVAHDPSKTFPLQKLQPRLRSCCSLLLSLQHPARRAALTPLERGVPQLQGFDSSGRVRFLLHPFPNAFGPILPWAFEH